MIFKHMIYVIASFFMPFTISFTILWRALESLHAEMLYK